MAQNSGHGVRRGGHVRIAQHGERTAPGLFDKADGRADRHRESSFATDQRAPDVEPVLGQQVLERVAGDLTAEAAQLRPDRGKSGPGHFVQRGQFSRTARIGLAAGLAEAEPLSGGGQHVESKHIVRGPPVTQRPRAARVIADHPADRAPGVAGRVGPEPEAEPGNCALQPGVDHTWLNGRRAGLGIHAEHPVQVPAEVQHNAGPDRVAGDRRPGAAAGNRGTERAAQLECGSHFIGVARAHDSRRDDAVGGRVRGVGGPVQGAPADIADTSPADGRHQLSGGHAGAGPPARPARLLGAPGSVTAIRTREDAEAAGSRRAGGAGARCGQPPAARCGQPPAARCSQPSARWAGDHLPAAGRPRIVLRGPGWDGGRRPARDAGLRGPCAARRHAAGT